MALSNYADLLASVAAWTNRSDLGSVVADCVVLCETDLNRQLRTPFNETTDTAFSVTGRYTALPNDFAEMRRVVMNYGAERKELVPLPQSGRVDESGTPWAYNIVNNALEVVPLSTAYTLELTYWTKVPALASNTTNAILTRFPDVYLFGTCAQVGFYMDDPGMTARFMGKFSDAVMRANRSRFGQMGTGLQVRAS